MTSTALANHPFELPGAKLASKEDNRSGAMGSLLEIKLKDADLPLLTSSQQFVMPNIRILEDQRGNKNPAPIGVKGFWPYIEWVCKGGVEIKDDGTRVTHAPCKVKLTYEDMIKGYEERSKTDKTLIPNAKRIDLIQGHITVETANPGLYDFLMLHPCNIGLAKDKKYGWLAPDESLEANAHLLTMPRFKRLDLSGDLDRQVDMQIKAASTFTDVSGWPDARKVSLANYLSADMDVQAENLHITSASSLMPKPLLNRLHAIITKFPDKVDEYLSQETQSDYAGAVTLDAVKNVIAHAFDMGLVAVNTRTHSVNLTEYAMNVLRLEGLNKDGLVFGWDKDKMGSGETWLDAYAANQFALTQSEHTVNEFMNFYSAVRDCRRSGVFGTPMSESHSSRQKINEWGKFDNKAQDKGLVML